MLRNKNYESKVKRINTGTIDLNQDIFIRQQSNIASLFKNVVYVCQKGLQDLLKELFFDEYMVSKCNSTTT